MAARQVRGILIRLRPRRTSLVVAAPLRARTAALALACATGSSPLAAALPAPAAPEAQWLHRVERGDTLIGLRGRVMRADADWRLVQRLNRIADPRRLQPGSTLRIPLGLLLERPAVAEVLHVHGEVRVERPGQAAQALAASTAVGSGDVLVTGPQSSLSLRFADGSSTLIGPDSRVAVERHVTLATRPGGAPVADTRLRIEGGSTLNRVPAARPASRFEIRTPAANLAVRGTEFRGRFEGRAALAEVTEGRLGIAGAALDAGFGARAEAGAAPLVRPLLPAPARGALPARIERVPLVLPLPAPGTLPGAAAWRAQVFAPGEPGRLLLDGRFEGAQAAWPDDLPDGPYELHLRAADADGIEGRTARLSFELKARPEPPFLQAPRAGERVETETVRLVWSRNPAASRYRLQIARDAGFTPPLVLDQELAATEAVQPLPEGAYHWRVRSIRGADDAGPFGDGQAFERVPPPPPPAAPAAEPPRTVQGGLMLGWAASALPGARYQLQVARDAGFTDIVADERLDGTEFLLREPPAGTYHVRVRTIAADGPAGAFGTAQLVEVPASTWWLWLLPLLLLL